MPSPPDRRHVAPLRFASAAIVTTCVFSFYQDEIVAVLLPLFNCWLGLVDGTYRTIDLSVIISQGESMVRRLATPASLQIVGGTMVYPDPGLRFSEQASTGIVLQPLILGISLLVSWPSRTFRELTVRFAVATVPMMLVMLLDVPMMLYGLAWFEELKAVKSDPHSFLVSWADAMNAGGRFALALVAVVASVRIGDAISSRKFKVARGLPAAPGTPCRPPHSS